MCVCVEEELDEGESKRGKKEGQSSLCVQPAMVEMILAECMIICNKHAKYKTATSICICHVYKCVHSHEHEHVQVESEVQAFGFV